ncbi:MAG: hypothetical protein BRC57_07515 [Cyanobacteria bacterium QS_8_48_54]|nr:MAG: hypothetical protein BRC57_07515 [Cyanobacteria bacterium QS_8_48_54]
MRVVAIEPNVQIREAASPHSLVAFQEGTGEKNHLSLFCYFRIKRGKLAGDRKQALLSTDSPKRETLKLVHEFEIRK